MHVFSVYSRYLYMKYWIDTYLIPTFFWPNYYNYKPTYRYMIYNNHCKCLMAFDGFCLLHFNHFHLSFRRWHQVAPSSLRMCQTRRWASLKWTLTTLLPWCWRMTFCPRRPQNLRSKPKMAARQIEAHTHTHHIQFCHFFCQEKSSG